ncbi:hypothetical protein SAMN00808754_1679 [Thermanaeromonas toyohensis ToBE]|uniref:Uncharacterized protein n=1 Tax=Thermanaeromonas toyohensis ToBE TaxID=698762 RepID=A0A1W1VU12_9FIRM|nr:hypothetical protein [Thermanaeromonas toyohensis]SMB96838.1 hypothetical protein SAMN00808754_1679 [Thermanaeromonas toyohensis ToBE]
MYWTRPQMTRWFEALAAGLIDGDQRLARSDGRPRKLPVSAVWEYLDSAGLVSNDEFDAFAGSPAARAGIVCLWHSASEEYECWLSGSPLVVEVETPFGPGVLSLHDFRPGADVYDYYEEGSEKSDVWGTDIVAVFELPEASFRYEVAGGFRVEWRGKIYENELIPRPLVRLLKQSKVKPVLNPWFALRLEKDNYADDVFVSHTLPESYYGLKRLFLDAAEEVLGRQGRPVAI